MPKNISINTKNTFNPSKINTFHENNEFNSSSTYKTILTQDRELNQNTLYHQQNQGLNNQKPNTSIEVYYFQLSLKLKIFILYGQIYFKSYFISLRVSTHYNSKHKCNLYIKLNREYLCRGYILH